MPLTDDPAAGGHSARRSGLTQRTIGGLLWAAWGKGAQAVLHLAVLAILARLLSPAQFGVVSAALVVIGFSAIFTHLGMGPALVQRPALESRHLGTATTFSLALGVAFAAAVAATAPLVAAFFRTPDIAPVLRLLAFVFPMQAIALVAESMARRELRFRRLANVDVAAYGIGYGVVGITAAALGAGVWALVAAELTRVAIHAGILVALQQPRPRLGWDRAAFVELMYFGGGFTIARVANYLAIQGDNLVVGRALGPSALGLYGRAYQLMAAPATGFGAVLDNVLFPAMARVQDDPHRLAGAYRRGVTLLSTLVLPVSVVSIVLAPEIIHLALGPNWAGVVLPFRVLAVGMLFRTSYKMSDSLCRATGAVYRRAVRQIVYAGLVIGGAAVGQRWGLGGVAAAVVGALVINFLLMAQLSLEVAQSSWADFARAHLPGLALGAACLPFTWGAAEVLRATTASPVVVFAFATLAGTIGAVATTLLAPRVVLGSDMLWILETIRAYRPRNGMILPWQKVREAAR